jgi:hypothetical protein
MRLNVLRSFAGCLALVASLAAAAHAQESAFQDAQGETSVFIREGGGFGRVNATDKSVEFGFLRDNGRETPYFGLKFKGKASNNFASLFKGGTPSSEAEIEFTLGQRFGSMLSDTFVFNRCIAKTAEELKKTLEEPKPKNRNEFLTEAKKQYIEVKTQEYFDQFMKEQPEGPTTEPPKPSPTPDVTQITANIWREIYADVKSKRTASGEEVPDAVAYGIATAAAPKKVEQKLAELAAEAKAKEQNPEAKEEALRKRAEEQAKREAENPETVKAFAMEIAKGEASNICAVEEPDIEIRAYDWLSFSASYKRASYKLLNEGGAFADQVRKQNFDGFSATLAYNRLISLDDLSGERERKIARRIARQEDRPAPREETPKNVQSKGSIILGISGGVARRNNSDDLDSVSVEDQSFTSSSGTTQRRAFSSKTALSGDYKEFIAVPLNTDVVWFPGRFDSRIAIDFFTRSNLGSTDRKFVPGVGLFLTKEKSPTKVVGGISFSYDDGKPRVGLIGGYHF